MTGENTIKTTLNFSSAFSYWVWECEGEWEEEANEGRKWEFGGMRGFRNSRGNGHRPAVQLAMLVAACQYAALHMCMPTWK